MLTGEYDTVRPDFIWVDRANRARRVVTEEAIEEKMESISRIGLIHPLVITREGKLVAGETRLMALKRLGWTAIPVQWSEDLEEHDLMKIEYEENYKRTDLPWQDQCDFLRRYHNLCKEDNPNWTQEDTAQSMGLDQTTVSKQLSVAEAIASGNQRVMETKEFSTAVGIAARQKERKVADELSMLRVSLPETEDEAEGPVGDPKDSSPILTTSFLDWVEGYEGAPFNLIHCDFPYGIGADKFNQGAADAFGGYDDSPETYWALVDALVGNKEKLLGGSGHLIFWFSMRWYTETLAALSKHFWVDPYPLVWHKSDNKGTLPDPTRGPRRVYEVAFLCSHGDRKIISAVSNTFSGPTTRVGEHMSEKSEDMLRHFMRMMVDENTRMLDPTCGSGSAVRAAASLGAGSVLGLEMNPEFADNARRAWDARQV
jgi:ParB/RepB/Spo0J family partition protein